MSINMIRKILLCCVIVYMYFISAFIQMDWYIDLKKSLNYGVENDLSFVVNKDDLSPGQRHLVEYQYPERVDTTFSGINSRDCVLERTHVCPVRCKQGNAPNSNISNDNAENMNNECNLYEVVNSCEQLKRVYGYNEFPVTQEEKSFPLAFAFKIHQLPVQAEVILRAIYRSHNVYCIHVDSQTDDKVFNLINKLSKCFDNIIVIKERERMIYSSYAHVMSDIKCMRAISNSRLPWRYYINLSGEEFPLKTNLEMVAILQLFQGTNDIETYDHPLEQNWKIENKFIKYKNSLAQDVRKSDFKYTMKFSKGNSFGLFSRKFVDFIFNDKVSQDILGWLNDTYSPEENIWSTLVTLPWAPGGYPVEVRHMVSSYVSRAMIFTGDSPRCYGKYVRGYCQFSCGDLPWLQSRPEFFASKLDFSKNNTYTLNCLYEWYKTKAYKPELVSIDWRFYSRLPHVKYHRQHSLMMESASKFKTIKREWLKKYTRKV